AFINLWPPALAIALANCHGIEPCLGQHHLNRKQRLSNLEGVFHCVVPAGQQLQPLLLVDDILTTGATALAAMAALEKAGHGLLGLACIARTPAPKKQEWVG
ncbi:MAG: hypothetical protein EBZ96_06430, partial [Synechococcaceae bacterium WB9_3_282]|nr:hypothetical protein [Synechococcaceae bacterium WB9_3_282]